VSDFIQLEQQFLAHDLESADFARILLLGKIDLSIPTLSNLSEDLEVTMSKSRSAFPQVCSLAA
jgi:hypothetical protein